MYCKKHVVSPVLKGHSGATRSLLAPPLVCSVHQCLQMAARGTRGYVTRNEYNKVTVRNQEG